MLPTSSFTPVARAVLVVVLGAGLSACSSIGALFNSDKIDYRSAVKTETKSLEVPPDLTQLARDSRYQLPGGVVSAAATAGGGVSAAAGTPAVSPTAVGAMRIQRDGDARWLTTPMTPEQLWPQVRAFWQERGFTIARESAETGVIETDWAENRANIPQDLIRRTIGRLIDGAYDTGERDRFRTRIERVQGGSEVFITHRGVREFFTNEKRENTAWTAIPADPQLEAEFLSRLMVRLGTPETVARAAVSTAPEATPRARLLQAGGTALEVDDSFDRAWRRLGLALDRSGFTVEDRDRTAGVYFVRYVDPRFAGQDEPGFFARLFSRESAQAAAPQRYRISVKSAAGKSTVAVLDSTGQASQTDNAKRIAAQLVNDLK
jgi:outer membrane protein assembly factor BamC